MAGQAALCSAYAAQRNTGFLPVRASFLHAGYAMGVMRYSSVKP